MKSHHKQVHGESIAGGNHETECANCGATVWKDYLYEIKRAENHFCDRDCKTAFHQVEYVCGTCGKEGNRREYAVEHANVSYCSRKCADLGRRERVEVECDQCGESNIKRPSDIERGGDGVYCGPECASRGREKKVEVVCSACGETLFRHPYKIESNERHFCDSKCMSIGYQGECVASSLGKAIRRTISDLSWQTTASDYRTGDKDVCELCGEESTQKRYDIHHIIPLLAGGVNAEWNYMTLCRSCHRKSEAYTKNRIDVRISELAKQEV
jgi:5-methylcytosine-specific restriction endonuclease McrA